MPRRGPRPIIQLLANLAKIAIPLIVIAYGAMWILNLDATPHGDLRVTTTVPGAEIHIDGKQCGAFSDTLVSGIPVGRRLITVRAPGYIADPEVIIVEIEKDRTASASFVMRDSTELVRPDHVQSRGVRQEIFSDDYRSMRSIPPAPPRSGLLDFSDPVVSDDDRSAANDRQVHLPNVTPRSENTATNNVITDEQRRSLSGTQITVTSDPPGARIAVNGARTTNSTPYTFRGLDRGYYVFSLDAAGQLCSPDSVEIVLVENGQSELAAFSLEPLEKLPVPQVACSTKPLAAGIKVNGTAVGVGSVKVSADYGQCVVEFADVPGYRTPDPIQITITRDARNQEVIGAYERLTGSAMLAVLPNDEFPRFDSKKLRIFVDNELILDAPPQKFDATLLGSLYPGERAVRIVYEDLAADEVIRLIDGQVAEVTLRIDAMFGKRKLKLKIKTDVSLDRWQARAKKLNVLTQS
ncbi:MAG: PEGA domain-containing protein [bacterium]|nr:PEGA domain-containing protein [bacterium]